METKNVQIRMKKETALDFAHAVQSLLRIAAEVGREAEIDLETIAAGTEALIEAAIMEDIKTEHERKTAAA